LSTLSGGDDTGQMCSAIAEEDYRKKCSPCSSNNGGNDNSAAVITTIVAEWEQIGWTAQVVWIAHRSFYTFRSIVNLSVLSVADPTPLLHPSASKACWTLPVMAVACHWPTILVMKKKAAPPSLRESIDFRGLELG